MTQAQHDQFGASMIETFDRFWPEGELLVYTEDHIDKIHKPSKRITVKSFATIEGMPDYFRSMSHMPILRGIIDGKRNYRYDLFGFSHKAMAQCDAATEWPGYLFWIDADVITSMHIPGAVLESWMDGHFMAVMKRKTWHMCSSFVGWDCAHSFSSGFWQHYFDLYASGKVLLLPEWHDAFVLEQTIQSVPGVRDLGAQFNGEGPYNIFDMVFQGAARHLKGNLKNDFSPNDGEFSPESTSYAA